MEKIKCSTPDFAKENAKKLLVLFPECEGQKGEVWDLAGIDSSVSVHMAGQAQRNGGGERGNHKDLAPLRGGKRRQGWNARRLRLGEPLHRGRQPRSAEAPPDELCGQGEDDLHRPAVQHGA